jgi:spore germination cell wall hydrolase CwlJ-like protein
MLALAVILATASAAIGSAMGHRTNTAPAVTAPAPAPIQDAVLSQLIAEHRCLSEALYYEARGEGRTGQQAVAEVVFHRMNADNYGHSICAVVYEGAGRRGCQFSFTCNGDLKRPREEAAWENSEKLAAEILTGEVRLRNATAGATHYHAVFVRPFWAPALKKTAQIGGHIFYREGRTRES